MNRKLLASGIAAILLAGCGALPVRKLDAHQGAALKGQAVAQVVRAKPDFVAMTPTRAVFGIIGAAASISAGNSIVAEHAVDDPADRIGRDLIAALGARYGAQAAGVPVTFPSSDTAAIVAALQAAGPYALDVQTTGWQLVYFPRDWTHYRVIYTANARLVDTASQTVVAQASCKVMPTSNAGAPTYDEILAENAAWLRMELGLAASACVDSMKTEMLSL